MPAPVSYPTAREVAVAIVAAARVTGQNPLNVTGDARGTKAKWYALGALLAACPDVHAAKVARWCGFKGKGAENAKYVLSDSVARGLWDWWRDNDLHAVKVALYAEIGKPSPRPASEPLPRPSVAFAVKRAPGPRVANPVLVPNGRRGASVDLHTAELMGDPEFERSALHKKLREKETADGL